MNRRPKLNDIAAVAGVSIGTVSRVLNGKGNIAGSTRDLVIQAAIQLGYVNSVNDDRLHALGIIKRGARDSRNQYDPFYGSVVAAVERECQQHGISVNYTTADTDPLHHMREMPSLLAYPQMPAFVLVGIRLQAEDVAYLLSQKRPIILVDSYAPSSTFDSVLTDNIDGAEQAVNHLIRAGHRNIGYVGCHDEEYPSILERYTGYLNVLKRNRLPTHLTEPCLCFNEDAYQSTINLIKRAPEVTAICVCNDRTTMAVIRAINDMGLAIPDDISVIGFDNWDPAKDTIPPLTTIQVDTERMGRTAVERLLQRFENPDEPVMKVVLGTHLVERESVRTLDSSKR